MANEDALDQRPTGDPRPGLLTDGFVSVMGGMNSGVSPSLLSVENPQFAFGVNLSSRGGLLKTRQVFKRLEAYIPPGKFQGAAMYRRAASDKIVFCVEGVVYTLDLSSFKRMKVGTFPTTDFDKAYFCQADKYMIVQNGIVYPTENWPIIFEGDFVIDNADVQYFDDVSAWAYLDTRADYEAVRVPIGTAMAYGHGRLFVAVPRIWDTGKISGTAQWLPASGKRSFVAGDIFQQDNPTEFLAFTENTYLSGGGALELPASMGSIQAMGFLRNSASGTGLGSLLVFGSDGVAAYSINAPRDQWQSIDLSQVLFMGAGTESNNSVLNINNDLFFRGLDGFRFVRYAITALGAASNTISNTPESFEISSILSKDDRNEVPFISAAFVDNRLYVTAAGATVSNEIHFDAIVSLDVATISSIASADPKPAYDGIWTGHSFLQVLKARYSLLDRLFAFVKVSNRNELWYLVDTSDSDYLDGGATQITSRLTTRIYDFKMPTRTKEFKYVEAWVSGARGSNTLKAYWRSDGYELWNACESYTFDASTPAAGSLPQSRWRLRLPPASTSVYDPVTERDVRAGTTFQFCFEWTGNLVIEKVLFHALAQPEATPDIYCEDADAVPLTEGTGGSQLDMYDYTIAPLTALAETWCYDCPTLGREPLFYWDFTSISDAVYGTITIVGPTNPGILTLPSGWLTDTSLVVVQDAEDIPPTIAASVAPGGTGASTLQIPYLSPGGSITVPVKVPTADGTSGNTYYCSWTTNNNVTNNYGVEGNNATKSDGTSSTKLAPDAVQVADLYLSCPSFGLTPGDPGQTQTGNIIITNIGSQTDAILSSLTAVEAKGVTMTYEIQDDRTGAWQTFNPAVAFHVAANSTKTIRVSAYADADAYIAQYAPQYGEYPHRLTDAITGANYGDCTINVTVTPQIPALTITPSLLTFLYRVGAAAPAAQSFTITNSGPVSLTWTIAANGDDGVGATLSKSTGTLNSGQTDTVSVTVPAGKASALYSTVYRVSSTGAESKDASVSLQVIPNCTSLEARCVLTGGSPRSCVAADNQITGAFAVWTGYLPTSPGPSITLGDAGDTDPFSLSCWIGTSGFGSTSVGHVAVTYDQTTGMPIGGASCAGTAIWGDVVWTWGPGTSS